MQFKLEKYNKMNNKKHFYIWVFLFLFQMAPHIVLGQVYFTNGLKIQEVNDTSAVIWTRLCKLPNAIPISHKQKEAPFRTPIDFDNNMPVNKMDGAVEGAFGEVKMKLFNQNDSIILDWKHVSPYRDYTIMEVVTGLNPNTEYQILYKVEKIKKVLLQKCLEYLKLLHHQKQLLQLDLHLLLVNIFGIMTTPFEDLKLMIAC